MLKGYLFLLAGYCKVPEEREREKLMEGQLNKKEPRLAGFENSQPLRWHTVNFSLQEVFKLLI